MLGKRGVTPPPVRERLPTGYRADLTCVFHQGAPGHDIEHCFALKKMVQKLIEVGLLPFEDLNPGMQIVSVSEQYQQQPRQQALQQALRFDPIPMKYAELLPTWLMENLVQTRPPPPIPKKLPTHWKPDLTWAFHQGAQGHDVENCSSLKIEVQKLIDAGSCLSEFESEHVVAIGSLLMFLLLPSCSNNVCLFVLYFSKIFLSRPRRK